MPYYSLVEHNKNQYKWIDIGAPMSETKQRENTAIFFQILLQAKLILHYYNLLITIINTYVSYL